MRIVSTETADEYCVAAAVRLGDPEADWLPVLRPRGSLLPALPFAVTPLSQLPLDARLAPAASWSRAELWWQGAAKGDAATWAAQLGAAAAAVGGTGAAAGEPSPGVVAAIGDRRWALAALLHARLCRRGFVWCETAEELVGAARGGAAALTVCAPLASLTLPVLDSVLGARAFRIPLPRLAAVSFAARPVSFLTARTLEIASGLVAKHHLYRQRPLRGSVWLFLSTTVNQATDPEVTLLARSDAAAAGLRGLPLDSDLMLACGHSREDIFYLGNDVLCGASREAAQVATTPETRLPACVHDGRCVKGGERISIADLPMKAFFNNGCSTLRLGGGSFAAEYTLGFTFLEGPGCLYVASSRTHYGTHHEQLLQYHLLRSGLTAAETVRLVNNTLPMGGAEVPHYLVLGEGDWRLFEPAPRHAEIAATERAGGGWRFECRDVDAHYLELRLPRLPAEPFVHAVQEGRGTELFHAVAPEPDGSARLFVFGWHRLRLGRLVVEVAFEAPAADRVAALRLAHQNLVYSRLYRTYSPKIKNLENELQSLSTYVARQLNLARRSPTAAARAIEKAGQVDDLLSRMNRLLCESLLDKVANTSFILTDEYMETDGSFEVAEHVAAGAACPYCGNVLLRRVIRHQINRVVRREVDICAVCGNIWDVPEGGIRPEYRNPAVLGREEPHAFEIVLRNTTARQVRGWIGFRLYRSGTDGVAIDPPLTEVTLAAGEERVLPFTLELSASVPAHMEFLKGFWIADLDISYFQRSIWITPGAAASAAVRLAAGREAAVPVAS